MGGPGSCKQLLPVPWLPARSEVWICCGFGRGAAHPSPWRWAEGTSPVRAALQWREVSAEMMFCSCRGQWNTTLKWFQTGEQLTPEFLTIGSISTAAVFHAQWSGARFKSEIISCCTHRVTEELEDSLDGN